jgi:dipeptidyl aminopeptidase/acylaminoacyl peptidase
MGERGFGCHRKVSTLPVPQYSGVNTYWARFNPINYVPKWSVPQLVIHGSKDYRVNETEAIAMFGALQA